MTDVVLMLDRGVAAAAASETAERLDAMGADASAAEARRYAGR
jgi:hypothetical protein